MAAPAQIEAKGLSPRQYYASGGEMRIGLVPDDVLLVPRGTPRPGKVEHWGQGFERAIPNELFNDQSFFPRDLSHRSNADTSTYIARGGNIRLKNPTISSPMVDVTESAMAIAMAKEGGYGIIHRGLTIERQTEEVGKTRDAISYVIEKPPVLPRSATVFDARQEMGRRNIGLVAVTDVENHIEGIITRRDVKKGWANDDLPLDMVLKTKPKQDLVTVLPDVEIPDRDGIDAGNIYVFKDDGTKILATQLMYDERVEKLLLADNLGHLVGAITDYDIRERQEHPDATIDNKGKLMVGAALPINGNYIARAEAVVEAGANLLCLDTANAYQDNALKVATDLKEHFTREETDTITDLKKRFPKVAIMIGSLATSDGVKEAIDAGADSIRGIIGGGSICITRGVSGFGVPSLTSVQEMSVEADKNDVPVIADGGVSNSSDMAKLIAAGARAVMLGRLLAPTMESSAEEYEDGESGQKYVLYYGMATERNRRILEAAEGKIPTYNTRKQEGVPSVLPRTGRKVKDVITNDLRRGLQSGMTYGGVKTIDQLRNEVDMIRITPAGQKENAVQDKLFVAR